MGRWRDGESVSGIARALKKPPGSIRGMLEATGGIAPPCRRGSRPALTPGEWEEISRGPASGDSIRAVARPGRFDREPGGGVELVDEGAIVMLRSSKTDRVGGDFYKGIPYGQHAQPCPVSHFGAWLGLLPTSPGSGPLFRGVDRPGNLSGRPMAPDSIPASSRNGHRRPILTSPGTPATP